MLDRKVVVSCSPASLDFFITSENPPIRAVHTGLAANIATDVADLNVNKTSLNNVTRYEMAQVKITLTYARALINKPA